MPTLQHHVLFTSHLGSFGFDEFEGHAIAFSNSEVALPILIQRFSTGLYTVAAMSKPIADIFFGHKVHGITNRFI